MPWKSLVSPRKDTVDDPGMCLRFAQSFFGAPVAYPDAWTAWENQQFRHSASEPLPNVPVVLWFSHYGTYGAPGQEYYKNWGHVAPYVPGDAIYSSPATWNAGRSQSRFSTIADLERALNCKYVGWSEDLNGLRIAEYSGGVNTDSKPKKKELKVKNYRRSDRRKRSIKPGERIYLENSKGSRLNCIGGIGPYSLTAHVYVDGLAPGDVIELRYDFYNDRTKKSSSHYIERFEADRHGMIRKNVEFKRSAVRGDIVTLNAYAGVKNKKTGTVSVLDSDAYLFIVA